MMTIAWKIGCEKKEVQKIKRTNPIIITFIHFPSYEHVRVSNEFLNQSVRTNLSKTRGSKGKGELGRERFTNTHVNCL